MFTALAYVSLFVMRIGGIGGFLTFDVKDAIIAIASMIFGPISGVVISLLTSLIEMIGLSETGPLGFLMNFVGTAVFAAVGSIIYTYVPRLKKTLAGAIVGLTASAVIMTAVMILMNLWITPIYRNVPVDVVKDMLLPVLLPFNLIKGILNAAVVLVLYKPLSVALKRSRFVDGNADKFKFDKKTVILTIIGLLIIVVCVLLLIFRLNGEFKWIG